MINRVVNIIKIAAESYIKYFYVAIGFALSLLALITALASESFDVFSGDLSYIFLPSNPNIVLVLLSILFATLIQSFFISFLIFFVRRDIQHRYDKTHVVEVLRELVWKILLFNLIMNLVLFVFYLIFRVLNIGFIMPLILIVVSLLTFYVNQSIIIDERGIFAALHLSLEFLIAEKFRTFAIILFLAIIYIIISLLSFYIPSGYIVGIILTHIFLIPFTEILKTSVYMTKFKIIESYIK